ncbi:hypothetical protein MMC17_004729 [Xylographa soralifera]|nr:hypothetical protein [Xylographa soralifera]
MCYQVINYYGGHCPHYYNTLQLHKCLTAEAPNGQTCQRMKGVWAKVDKACRICRNDPHYPVWDGYPMLGSIGRNPVKFDLAKTLKEARYEPCPDGVPMKSRIPMKALKAMQRASLGSESGQAEKGVAGDGGDSGCCVCM